MYLQEILEVGIGLVFMWLVISLAAMQLQEWIANLFEWRARDMEAAIRRMLTGEDVAAKQKLDEATAKLGAEAKKAAEILTDRFYKHPLIMSLSGEPGFMQRVWLAVWNAFRRLFRQPAVQKGRPSYIPNDKFTLALFDIILNADTDGSLVKKALGQLDQAFDEAKAMLKALKNPNIEKTAKPVFKQALDDLKQIAGTPLGDNAFYSIRFNIESLAQQYPDIQPTVEHLLKQILQFYSQIGSAQKQALVEISADGEGGNGPKGEEVLKRLRAGIVALGATNPALSESLRSLTTGVEGYAAEKEKNLAVARKNVEDWFDDAMTRLSGWYKRKAQLSAFLIGLFLAILLNVDSIQVASSLWREPTLRQQLVAQAEAYAKNTTTLPANGDGSQPTYGKTVAELQDQLKSLSIPFGWETKAYVLQAGESCRIIPVGNNAIWGMGSGDVCKQVSNAPVDATGWLSKIAGILISAIAAAQGAPFWFDVLKRLVNVRSAGANPAEQPSN